MVIDDDLVYKEIGDRIKQVRTEEKLTQEKFADEIGVSRVSLANYESGKQSIYISDIYKIAAHFNIPISALIPSLEDILIKSSPTKVVEQDSALNDNVKDEIIKFIQEGHFKEGKK